MNLSERISALSLLGTLIEQELTTSFKPVVTQAIEENRWYTEQSIKKALLSVSDQYLKKSVLSKWSNKYRIVDEQSKKVGLILAGNIPMVGIHDVISVFISGHISLLKYSSKDKVLIPFLISKLEEIDPRTRHYFIPVEKLHGMDAVIATGGETAATHFHYYFSKYPNIIRKNRSSVAVISERDSQDQLSHLGADIFDYFGLGCRSISKIYLPDQYNINRIFEALVDYGDIIDHNKYKNNYDYSYSIYLLGKQKFLTNNFLILMEEKRLASRIACLHYEFYKSKEEVVKELQGLSDQLQCIASSESLPGIKTIPFGTCQSPAIDDYADGIDTLEFLTGLYDL